MLRESLMLCSVPGGDELVDFTVDTLLTRLTKEFSYPESGARIVAERLVACAPQVKNAFGIWWQTGELMDLQVEGFTAQRLVEEHGMKPIAAFLTLDWLVREPEKARASLSRGHDQVG